MLVLVWQKLKISIPGRGAIVKQSLHIAENKDHSYYRILMRAYKTRGSLEFSLSTNSRLKNTVGHARDFVKV